MLVSPAARVAKSGADLKANRIATGKGSIGHFVALESAGAAGISPEGGAVGVPPGPVDAKVALLNGSVDAWGLWEPLHHPNGEDQRGPDPSRGAAKGCCRGMTFLAGNRIPRLTIPQKRAALQGLSPAPWPAPSAGPTPISTATAKTLGRSSASRRGIGPGAVCQRASREWQPAGRGTVAQQQTTRRTLCSPTA